jgi:hypothetical protein
MEIRRSNQKEEVPFSHYREIYRSLDPRAISTRCALPFDGSSFSLILLGTEYRVPHPAFALRPLVAADTGAQEPGGAEEASSKTATGNSIATACDILILRYLCEGRYANETGKRLSYNEVPWGPVYYRNFDGRCLKRLAYGFGRDIPRFKAIIEGMPGLKAEKLPQGDAGYRVEFLSGLYISLILYAEDDEFPPSAQILFDDNFVHAFTAEDLAVVGEVVIDRLKRFNV